MPIVTINIVKGRDEETLRACLRAVHEAVRDSLGVPDSSVRILMSEVEPDLWSAGGQTVAERSRP
jgi:4-oxalocrotonate tautomerase